MKITLSTADINEAIENYIQGQFNAPCDATVTSLLDEDGMAMSLESGPTCEVDVKLNTPAE